MMTQYQKLLQQVEARQSRPLREKYGLVCRQLPFDDASSVLYVAKPHWTNRFDHDREKTVGIFFAVWVSDELIEQRLFAYNMHALKLRELRGYKLTSRRFADSFRTAVQAEISEWPGVRTDFGPLTLLEGREHCDPQSFERKATERVSDFIRIHHVVDDLLAQSLID